MNGGMDGWVERGGEPPSQLSHLPPTGPTPTTEALEDEVEFAARLEGVGQLDDEGMPHRLQNVPLRPGMRCVFGVAHDFGLEKERC